MYKLKAALAAMGFLTTWVLQSPESDVDAGPQSEITFEVEDDGVMDLPIAKPVEDIDIGVASPDVAEKADNTLNTLKAWHKDTEAANRGDNAMLESRIDGQEEQLGAILAELKIIRSEMVTKAEFKEGIASLRKVIVEYRTPTGATGSAAVSIDESGKGTTELPPGAVVTSMGGVPLSMWNETNPSNVVSSGGPVGGSDGGPFGSVVQSSPVSAPSNGCNGGSLSMSVPVQSSYSLQSSAPVQPYESQLAPLSAYDGYEVDSLSTSSYEIPEQVGATVDATDDSTIVSLQVSDDLLSSPVPLQSTGECYTDVNGNTVCPTAASSPAPRTRTTLLGRGNSRPTLGSALRSSSQNRGGGLRAILPRNRQ